LDTPKGESVIVAKWELSGDGQREILGLYFIDRSERPAGIKR
jgi:hypothetical protein